MGNDLGEDGRDDGETNKTSTGRTPFSRGEQKTRRTVTRKCMMLSTCVVIQSHHSLTSFHCLTEDEVVQVDVRLLHAGLGTAVDCLRSRVVHKVILVKMTLACLGAYGRTTQSTFNADNHANIKSQYSYTNTTRIFLQRMQLLLILFVY